MVPPFTQPARVHTSSRVMDSPYRGSLFDGLALRALAIAFGFSWLVAAILALGGGIGSPARHVAGGFAFMLGPAIAALVVVRRLPREQRRAALGFERPLAQSFDRSLLFAWLVPALAVAAATLGSALLPHTELQSPATALAKMVAHDPVQKAKLARIPPGALSALLVFQSFVVGPLMNAPFMLSEELGWRGLLWSRWRALGFARQAIATGVVWGLPRARHRAACVRVPRHRQRRRDARRALHLVSELGRARRRGAAGDDRVRDRWSDSPRAPATGIAGLIRPTRAACGRHPDARRDVRVTSTSQAIVLTNDRSMNALDRHPVRFVSTLLFALVFGCSAAGCGGSTQGGTTTDDAAAADDTTSSDDAPASETTTAEDSAPGDSSTDTGSPADAPPPGDGGVAKQPCLKTTALSNDLPHDTLGALEGDLVAIDCPGDYDHMHLQVAVGTKRYDIAIPVNDSMTHQAVGITTKDLGMGSAAPGWSNVGLSYTADLGLHSDAFTMLDRAGMIAHLKSELQYAHVSIHGKSYSDGTGVHDVHYKDGTHDGVVILRGRGAGGTDHYVAVRYSTPTF